MTPRSRHGEKRGQHRDPVSILVDADGLHVDDAFARHHAPVHRHQRGLILRRHDGHPRPDCLCSRVPVQPLRALIPPNGDAFRVNPHDGIAQVLQYRLRLRLRALGLHVQAGVRDGLRRERGETLRDRQIVPREGAAATARGDERPHRVIPDEERHDDAGKARRWRFRAAQGTRVATQVRQEQRLPVPVRPSGHAAIEWAGLRRRERGHVVAGALGDPHERVGHDPVEINRRNRAGDERGQPVEDGLKRPRQVQRGAEAQHRLA